MAQWYVIRSGQEQGPITDQQLQELASTGALQPTHEVRRRGTGQRVIAAKVQGLVFGNKAAKATSAAGVSLTQPPPLPPMAPPPLPFMQPPPLPPQIVESLPPARTPAIERRLNPNLTFLLGIWAGLGLCAAAFAFLAITGRFGPLVRWLETAAREKQGPAANPGQPASSAAKSETKVETRGNPAANSPKPPRPKLDSPEFREGYAEGLSFGKELGKTLHITGQWMTEADLCGDVDGVRQYDVPYPANSRQAEEWLIGWEEGARVGLGKNLITD